MCLSLLFQSNVNLLNNKKINILNITRNFKRNKQKKIEFHFKKKKNSKKKLLYLFCLSLFVYFNKDNGNIRGQRRAEHVMLLLLRVC